MEVWKVCEFAAAALVHAGHDPRHPFRWSDCPGCISKLNAVVGLLRCESGLNPRGYDEGYVAGTWNESRGIAQIGNGWDHIATDAEAYSWKWSVAWLIEDLRRLTTRWYPECGSVSRKWNARCALLPDDRAWLRTFAGGPRQMPGERQWSVRCRDMRHGSIVEEMGGGTSS